MTRSRDALPPANAPRRSGPPALAVAALALVVASLVIASLARRSGDAHVEPPPSPVVQERLLRFKDLPSGEIQVIDSADGRIVTLIGARESAGFVRATLRTLMLERKAKGGGQDAPLHLVRRADGRLLLSDPQTGRLLDLAAYGQTNAAAFAVFLGR